MDALRQAARLYRCGNVKDMGMKQTIIERIEKITIVAVT